MGICAVGYCRTTLDHGQGAAQQIADAVGQVAVDAGDHRGCGEIAILPERHFAQEEIAEGIDAEVSTILLGSTTLPRLFDIFSPSTVHQPWAKIVSGSGRLSAISIVDQ